MPSRPEEPSGLDDSQASHAAAYGGDHGSSPMHDEPAKTSGHVLRKASQLREDIQILRCLAIVLVVLFHCKLDLFKAGYIGVDVFLVISGYLMHQIITKGLKTSTFSFSNFFVRRILRLYPAYCVFLTIITVYASTQLHYFEYETFSSVLTNAVLQTVNIYLFKHTGYFDAGSGNNYLLHLWSISLEWQFYLIFPLILHFSYKTNISRLMLLVCLFVCSFLLSLYSFHDAKMAFYLLPFRIWEFLAGAIAAELSRPTAPRIPKKRSLAANVAGYACILVPIVLYPSMDTSSFPGLLALPPVLGTALLLAAGGRRLPNRRFGPWLAPFVWIGNLSYSIYLYHWPIVVHFGKTDWPSAQAGRTLSVLLATLLCGLASYGLVENVFRRIKGRAVVIAGCAVAASCCVLALAGHERTVLASRLDEQQIHFQAFAHDAGGLDGKNVLGAPGVAPTYLFFGDSHAQALMRVFDDIGVERNVSGRFFRTNHPLFHCARLLDYKKDPEAHRNDHAEIARLIQEFSIKNVVIAARWSWYVNGYLPHETDVKSAGKTEMLCLDNQREIPRDAMFQYGVETTVSALKQLGVENVWIILPVPEQHFDVPSRLASRKAESLKLVSMQEYEKRHAVVLRAFSRAKDVGFIDVASALASLGDGAYFPVLVGDTPLYVDDDHLSYHGTLLVKNALLPFFQSLR